MPHIHAPHARAASVRRCRNSNKRLIKFCCRSLPQQTQHFSTLNLISCSSRRTLLAPLTRLHSHYLVLHHRRAAVFPLASKTVMGTVYRLRTRARFTIPRPLSIHLVHRQRLGLTRFSSGRHLVRLELPQPLILRRCMHRKDACPPTSALSACLPRSHAQRVGLTSDAGSVWTSQRKKKSHKRRIPPTTGISLTSLRTQWRPPTRIHSAMVQRRRRKAGCIPDMYLSCLPLCRCDQWAELRNRSFSTTLCHLWFL